ncbi:MAG: N-acetylmuramoyl-L-alanine amidase-like domain-containing protein [Verrucomicrobiota bacterium]
MRCASRRTFLKLLPAAAPLPAFAESGAAQKRALPLSTIFKGEDRFRAIVNKAISEEWRQLPMGDRVIKFARELHGLPYENFTLEIDDHIESPSVNLNGLDCWTFFEQSLGMARMVAIEKEQYTPEDLLREIEFTRYRAGVCTGNYLERIHYLAEWFFENDARGSCRHITKDFPGAEQIHDRRISEMTILWEHYRYLKNNPDLREPMKTWEEYVAAMPVYHIPKTKVAAIEPQLQNGDVIGIATKHHGGFCSHVGLIVRTDDGVARFMHASRNYKKVVIDKSISGYLNSFSSHAGMIVGRPLEVEETVTDPATYRENLEKLIV